VIDTLICSEDALVSVMNKSQIPVIQVPTQTRCTVIKSNFLFGNVKMQKVYRLKVTNKMSLIVAIMDKFCGNSQLSLEGDLSQCDFHTIQGATDQESTTLKRNTISPLQDVIVFPLTPVNVINFHNTILPHIGISSRVYHIQVEQSGRLVFGSYDQFSPQCIWIDASVSEKFILEIINNKTASAYELIEI
jgi:hypothetical protein